MLKRIVMLVVVTALVTIMAGVTAGPALAQTGPGQVISACQQAATSAGEHRTCASQSLPPTGGFVAPRYTLATGALLLAGGATLGGTLLLLRRRRA